MQGVDPKETTMIDFTLVHFTDFQSRKTPKFVFLRLEQQSSYFHFSALCRQGVEDADYISCRGVEAPSIKRIGYPVYNTKL